MSENSQLMDRETILELLDGLVPQALAGDVDTPPLQALLCGAWHGGQLTWGEARSWEKKLEGCADFRESHSLATFKENLERQQCQKT